MTLPTVVTKAGMQPTPPAQLLIQLLAAVASTNPGYTANLPGSLIEDISSTDVAAMVVCDNARVETVNSLTSYGANDFLLNQLGQVYGVPIGEVSNTSVFEIFQAVSAPGLVIGKGFTVSDGTHQYIVQDGGIIQSDGNSTALFCLASVQGSWAVPANTVNALVTSAPGNITLTCNNPETGIPGAGGETAESYRSRVLQAGLAASQGMPRYLKTLLSNVSGVQPRLVSPVQKGDGTWEIICGGGDPYAVAYAIYTALGPMISMLAESEILVTAITRATNGNVTTDLNHGFVTGANITITGTTPGNYSGNWTGITVVGEKNFLIGNTSSFSAYSSGGVVTPNARNITVTVNDYPDNYAIVYVNPPAQTVTIAVTWNTTATNLVSDIAMAQAAQQPLADYINNIVVGQPINQFELQTIFQGAVASLVPPQLLTRMVFVVTINGITTNPDSGTGIIDGDPESFFTINTSDITVTRG